MTKPALRIIFAGTPDFAATALAALLGTEHHIIGVYTQPDRPAGRGRQLQASPVKQLALSHALQVFQPENFKDTNDITQLQQLDADLMIVAAYGLLLPKTVLEAPKLGCINIHASLLPRWRGAAPIQRAILAGDTETGITIMQMNEGLDTGDMLLKLSCPITDIDTGGSLHDRLAEMGAVALLETLVRIQAQTLNPQPQDNALSTYARKLDKTEAMINWHEDAAQINRQIRAFNPWPVAQTAINKQTLRIWSAEVINDISTARSPAPPGSVISCSKKGIDIACGTGVLRLTQLQPAGKKSMDAAAFLNGYADLLPLNSVLN
ncbi:MAG: methionyl-tRNA formyltransferase [Gammaproteobacteria bacterium]|nr:methionyl-tRNA formyltransferase [Gammaproteobacteria bacterium]